MYRSISLALLMATVPAIVRAQTTPVVEISEGHGHTFTIEGSQARIVKAWPGMFEAFDFGEHPKIPNAKFIFVKLKPGAKLNSTTLTLIIDDGLGKETTKSYVLKRVKGIPSQTTTLIGNQPVYAAQSQPAQSVTGTNVFSPPPRLDKQIKKEKKGKKTKTLKVSKEFSSAFSSGFAATKANDEPVPVKESKQPAPEETEDSDVPDLVEPKSEDKAEKSQSGPLPLIRAPKTLQAKATIETPTEKTLIERSSLDNYAIANYLLRGLYRAERLKQINSSKPQFGQTHSMARWLRQGHNIDKALELSGLPPVTFNNLLGHGGVGK
ncbi:hypothetical protein ACSYAD_25895 [Acaryochloris marina NIES-2412]|uniref:hypothetical protein n=1 Tax=Acaryochloris marina TaxID=155978 RepID=UPI004059BE18